MFKIVDDLTFTWPVDIKVPADGGTFNTHEIDVMFKCKEQSEINKLVSSSDVDLLQEVVVGWEKVQDEDGNEVPFSAEILDRLIAKPYVRTALASTYLQAVNGIERKN